MNFESYDIIYRRYFRLARKVANDVLRDYDLSGDVAQEVFMEMFEKKDSLDERLIKYWIVTNVNRRAIDQCRKAYQAHEILPEEEEELDFPGVGNEGGNPESILIGKENMGYGYLALVELRNYNEIWYELLVRHHVEGTDYQDLAREYGMELNSLRVQVHRARKWLNRKIIELKRKNRGILF